MVKPENGREAPRPATNCEIGTTTSTCLATGAAIADQHVAPTNPARLLCYEKHLDNLIGSEAEREDARASIRAEGATAFLFCKIA